MDANRLQDELTKIQRAIAAQEGLRGIMPAEEIEATLTRLREQAAAMEAQLSGVGGIAQGAGATAVTATAGGTAIGRVEGNVYIGPPAQNPAEALTIYRRVLFNSRSRLSLRGLDKGAGDPLADNRLNLANVYIAVDTTAPAREKAGRRQSDEALPARLKEAGGSGEVPGEVETSDIDEVRVSDDDLPDWLKEIDEKPAQLSALAAVIDNRALVLLGDPGGGKSTFVNHLAVCLVGCALEPDGGWLAHLDPWPETEAALPPLVVILRDFARSLPEPLPRPAAVGHLWRFITDRLAAQNLSFVAEPLQQALEQGRVLVLLDGLDEVPSAAERGYVREAVQALMARYPGNRYLVTCRTLSYQPPAQPGQPDWRLPASVPVFELAPFDADKIERFINAWYAELDRLGGVQDGPAWAEKLQSAVRRPDLRELATNPLLLTVMALVHTHKGELPEARALLYEEAVEILLWRWEQLKRSDEAAETSLRQLLREANRTEMDLRKLLWQVAYKAHAQGAAQETAGQPAGVDELKLRQSLAALKANDWNWANRVLETMRLRAGLLLERGQGVFTFPHRTFQEYLAGAHLAAQSRFGLRCAALAETDPQLWREVILLAVGRLVYISGDTTDKPLALVGELCPAAPQESETAWRKAWLAGEVLLEIGVQRMQDSALGRDLGRRVRGRLADLLEQGRLAPRERAEAGDVLAELGDPREAVTTVDGMTFFYVPPGPFWMGSRDEDALADDNEKPLHQMDLPGYWIARYPVTVAQFKAFVAAAGRRPEYDASLRDPSNRPVRYVTWREAVAFCEWLTGRWREALPENWAVRLPGEAQWEKAARGGLQVPRQSAILSSSRQGFEPPEVALRPNEQPQRRYPWGDRIDPDRANYRETNIGTTGAVGCFPAGASPYGCLEMSGNLWEWCRTKWQDSYWDYQDDNDLEGGDDIHRVMRGGAFDYVDRSVRCAARGRLNPSRGHGNRSRGFRVVVSPF